ncbi:amidohydrolase family protein [Nocardioides luteus]|uniref:amidohydrolase family protein n=1 Tax=Nocardioides luteus TaxID=1844 RepID=UPI0018C9F0AA|nr:amidohydrolase family protein [Nocardioides luteus]MBG6096840.1 aminocarboxymuconate-semialdehyde decarboxylase [Nocardioides luteus]
MTRTDIHVHVAPALDSKTAATLSGASVDSDGRIQIDGRQVGPAKLYDVPALEAYLAAAGLDHAIVSLPPPFYRQQLSVDEARAWVRAVNDGILARIGEHPALTALVYLPLEHPELAVEEYQRTRSQKRFVGATAAAGGRSALGTDPRLVPLWEALDADGAALLLHPGTSPDHRLDDFYLSNLLGNPSETTVSVAHLALGGVLQRYPDMQVVLVHCGGTLPAIVGRWERGAETHRPGLEDLAESPRESIRRLYVDCLAHDPAVVDLAVGIFGEEHILLGSDWPFPMGTDDPIALIQHLDGEFVERVATDNPAKVFPAIKSTLSRAG